jgi:outer membrane biosynthesis protein TonB
MLTNHQTPTAMNARSIRIALAFATVLTLGYARAAEPVRFKTTTRSSIERNLDRALNRELSFPVLAKGDMTGKVHVSFVIDKEGKVEVVSCSSPNEQLKEYVLRKLARIDVGENPDGIWKTTHLVIDFHKQNG